MRLAIRTQLKGAFVGAAVAATMISGMAHADAFKRPTPEEAELQAQEMRLRSMEVSLQEMRAMMSSMTAGGVESGRPGQRRPVRPGEPTEDPAADEILSQAEDLASSLDLGDLMKEIGTMTGLDAGQPVIGTFNGVKLIEESGRLQVIKGR